MKNKYCPRPDNHYTHERESCPYCFALNRQREDMVKIILSDLGNCSDGCKRKIQALTEGRKERE